MTDPYSTYSSMPYEPLYPTGGDPFMVLQKIVFSKCPRCGSVKGSDSTWRYVDGDYQHKCANVYAGVGHGPVPDFPADGKALTARDYYSTPGWIMQGCEEMLTLAGGFTRILAGIYRRDPPHWNAYKASFVLTGIHGAGASEKPQEGRKP